MHVFNQPQTASSQAIFAFCIWQTTAVMNSGTAKKTGSELGFAR
jgi:hypothetical protein